MTVVSDTSPITNLAAVGQLDLLREIYGTIILPQAVYDELTGLGYTVPRLKYKVYLGFRLSKSLTAHLGKLFQKLKPVQLRQLSWL